MRKTVTLVTYSLLLVLAGCGSNRAGNTGTASEPNSATVFSSIDMTAKINPKTATVELPGDKFNLTYTEKDWLAVAEQVAWATCAKKLDIPYFARKPGQGDAPEYAIFNKLGPWTEEMANRFAFTRPKPLYWQIVGGIIPEPKGFKYIEEPPLLSDEQHDILENKCKVTPEAKYFNALRLDKIAPVAAFELHFSEMERAKLPKSKAYLAALKDLDQCYQKVGIQEEEKKDGKITYREIVGANYHKVDEQQISMALKVVECKSKVDFVNRVAQEAAKLQAPIIEKNIKELTAWRAEADATLKKAKEYIATHQDVIMKD